MLALLVATLLLTACGGDDGLDTPAGSAANDQDQDQTTATIDDSYEYQLPVIFHVLYRDKDDASQYIPAARLRGLLQYVNELYRGGIYSESPDVKVKFVLAQVDERGRRLATPGVEYIYYSGEYPIDETEFMVAKDNAKYIWDPNDYINVMVYPFKKDGGSENLGISHMPYTVKGSHKLAGLETVGQAYIDKSQLGYPMCLSISSRYMGAMAEGGYYQSDRYADPGHEATYISQYDVVVTLAHELGHYLGLFHVFSESGGHDGAADIFAAADSCADTDYCTDTPTYNRSEYEADLTYYRLFTAASQQSICDLLRRNACDGSTFYSNNIMDYAYTLGHTMTAEQKARMRHVLYYSPLIPGPKRNKANKRAAAHSRAGGADTATVYTRSRLIY